MTAIDFHTHAFPDFLAERAVAAIEENAVAQHAYLDGTVGGLLRSMDRAGVDISVVASIATADKQVASILKWSLSIASDRIIPFASAHPLAADPAGDVRRIAEAGLKGVKLHPLYQDFDPLDERAMPLYAAVAEAGLVLLFHSGDDLRFIGDHRCAPDRMLEIKRRFPSLKMVLAHLGGFWTATAFADHPLADRVHVELSHTIPAEPSEWFERVCRRHAEQLMFGTDSPWNDQGAEIAKLRRAVDDPALLDAILYVNAARLLGLKSSRQPSGISHQSEKKRT